MFVERINCPMDPYEIERAVRFLVDCSRPEVELDMRRHMRDEFFAAGETNVSLLWLTLASVKNQRL